MMKSATGRECNLTAKAMRELVRRIRTPVVAAGRRAGYAIAFHGSLRRDIDLIAVPWTEEAKSPDELAAIVARAARGWVAKVTRASGATAKPHGRLAFTIFVGKKYDMSGTYIDLSVTPRAQVAPP